MDEPLLLIEALRKQFGARTVLDVDALRLYAGRSYALTGDNGTGKTTLLRVIAGLEPAECRRASYGGRDVDLRAYPEWLRRDVIYVHQHPYLFHTSVEDNIGYGLTVRGIHRRERDALVREAISWARVQHLLDAPVNKLSAGERQRVALARARVLKPRIFLLDEPTANLDSESRQQTIGLVRDLCNSDGVALIACHDLEIIQLPGVNRLYLCGGHIDSAWTPLPKQHRSGPIASEEPVHHGPQRQPVVNE
jgi:tungstate transport system ATP-binding protein